MAFYIASGDRVYVRLRMDDLKLNWQVLKAGDDAQQQCFSSIFVGRLLPRHLTHDLGLAAVMLTLTKDVTRPSN